VLDKAEQEVVMAMMQDLVKNINKGSELKNQKGKPLTQPQKNAFLDMEDFRAPIKGIEDIKIKIKPIDEFLKNNPDTRLHIIESPRIPEKKPFAMMGTKETTYENVMKPAVMRALQQ
jgi:hypothetical protein